MTAMAWAEPAVPVTCPWQGHATEMCADAHHHKPLHPNDKQVNSSVNGCDCLLPAKESRTLQPGSEQAVLEGSARQEHRQRQKASTDEKQ